MRPQQPKLGTLLSKKKSKSEWRREYLKAEVKLEELETYVRRLENDQKKHPYIVSLSESDTIACLRGVLIGKNYEVTRQELREARRRRWAAL